MSTQTCHCVEPSEKKEIVKLNCRLPSPSESLGLMTGISPDGGVGAISNVKLIPVDRDLKLEAEIDFNTSKALKVGMLRSVTEFQEADFCKNKSLKDLSFNLWNAGQKLKEAFDKLTNGSKQHSDFLESILKREPVERLKLANEKLASLKK